MDNILLSAHVRDHNVKANVLRRQGLIPAVYYGAGQKTVSLTVPYKDFSKVYEKAGESTLIDLDFGGKTAKVLVQSIQFEPVVDSYEHIDFIHVDMKKEVTTHVPLKFTGEAPAVKDLAGVLTISKHEVEVKCLPDRLPHSLSVDVSGLVDFHTSIYVKDILLPEGVMILDDSSLTIVTVTAPREEEKEEVVVAPAATAEGAVTPEAGAGGSATSTPADAKKEAEGGEKGKQGKK